MASLQDFFKTQKGMRRNRYNHALGYEDSFSNPFTQYPDYIKEISNPYKFKIKSIQPNVNPSINAQRALSRTIPKAELFDPDYIDESKIEDFLSNNQNLKNYTAPSLSTPSGLNIADNLMAGVGVEGGPMNNQALITRPNWDYYTPQNNTSSRFGGAANAAGTAGGLKGLFSKAKAGAGTAGNYVKNNFGWNKGSGLTAFGKNVGKAAPWVQGGLGALQAAQGISQLSNASSDTDDITGDILRSAASNPLNSSYLSSDQLSLLNQLRRGNFDDSWDVGDVLSGVGSGLGNTLMQAGIGLGTGGIPGAIVGGVSGLVNSGIEGATRGQQESTAELEGLYQALMDAESQYRSMKRPNFTGLGIQRQYQNMYG